MVNTNYELFSQLTLREINGEFILYEPELNAEIERINKQNCEDLYNIYTDKINKNIEYILNNEMSHNESVIFLANADDINGSKITNILLPDHDWSLVRDKGHKPVLCGYMNRTDIQAFLDIIDENTAQKLREATGMSIIVIDSETTELFEA